LSRHPTGRRARTRLACLALCARGAAAGLPGSAETTGTLPPASAALVNNATLGLSDGDKARYRSIFVALRDQKWSDARAMIDALDAQDAMRPLALSELYLAKGSPSVELFDLLDLVNKAAWLPKADQLSRLAQKRGATILPTLPQVQKMVWLGAAPRREYVAAVKTDMLAQALAGQIQTYIKADNPIGAEALLASGEAGLTPEGLTEVRQRVAWAYYIESDDSNARRMAARALEARAGGDWSVQAHWTAGLAAWRQNDCRAAAPSFANVAALAGNNDMRAAGAYWASRAYMVCGEADKVQNYLKLASRSEETFYGLLARESLGLPLGAAPVANRFGASEWQLLKDSPNARAAIALSAIGETGRAEELLRHQAKIGGTGHYDALIRLASALSLPETQLWLAHNGPAGKQPESFARFPAPNWQPDGGWRVDPALIYELIRRHKVTHMCGAPIVYAMLINAPDGLRAGIEHSVAALIAGAAPPAAIIEGAEKIGFDITHVYGLTETYGPASVCAKHPEWDELPIDRRAERNGRQGVRYHMQEAITVLDPMTMEPVPADGETMGEIMFRGNLVMKGYLKNEKATQEAFAGGWFHTGDLAVLHPDGYVKIKDRSKDVIISGGENISSLEVEDVLYRHPAVMTAAVVARPDEKWGEVPAAYIEIKEGAGVTADDIIAHCREHLARYKVPKHIEFCILPKTSTGKIQKFALREMAKSASAIA